MGPFGETRVGETLGPGGPSPTHTYPHLPRPTPTYGLVTPGPKMFMKIINCCYTSLLIFNISLYGTFPKSVNIIDFCYTSMLKHTFSILQENVAIAHVTKNHVIIE